MRAFFVVSFVLLTFAIAMISPTLSARSIVGTWKLLSMTFNDDKTGKSTDWWGKNPIGFLTYTHDGRMSAVIAARERPIASTSTEQASLEEQAKLFRTCFAYAGSYTTNEKGVIHHVEVANDPSWVGKDQVRYVRIEGKRLIITAPPIQTVGDSHAKALTLVWERLE